MMDLDIWRSDKSSLDVRIPDAQLLDFEALLPSSTNLTTFIPDLQTLIDSSNIHTTTFEENWDVSTINTPFHDQYHPVLDMNRFAEQMAQEFNGIQLADGNLRMETFVLGETFEKMEMKGVRVKWVPETTKPTGTAEPKPLPTETGARAEAEMEKRGRKGKNHGKGKKGKGKSGKSGKSGKGKGGKGKGKKVIEREFVIQSGSHAREVSFTIDL